MKKAALTLVTLIVLFITATTALAANPINVTIDGKKQTYEVPPQIINGRTMLPLRAVCESLGITVDYNASTSTATMTKSDTKITHKIGTSTITINGKTSTFDTPSTIISNRTLVPLRMLAEAINAKVEWIPETSTAAIFTQKGLSAGKTPIQLDANTTIYLEDVIAHIGSQKVLTNKTTIFDESEQMVTLQSLADTYKPYDPKIVGSDILYATAKGFIEAYYNLDYTQTTADAWWDKIYPHFNNTFRTKSGKTGRQSMDDLVQAAKDQKIIMKSIFVSDPSLVYTVNPNIADLNAAGQKDAGITPWAIRGTLYYYFDSITTSDTFWDTDTGVVPNQWYAEDVEIRLGINERITPHKATAGFGKVFWLSPPVKVN